MPKHRWSSLEVPELPVLPYLSNDIRTLTLDAVASFGITLSAADWFTRIRDKDGIRHLYTLVQRWLTPARRVYLSLAGAK